MIVLPMGGLSSRFFNAGYQVPKYQLELHGRTVFERVLLSFKKYFTTEKFLFVAVDNRFNPRQFIEQQMSLWPNVQYEIVILPEATKGQAETVFLGCNQINLDPKERITIFNIDTFRPHFEIAKFDGEDDRKSYLETFIGSGKNWSNVVPVTPGSDKAKAALEKQEASEFCCTGVYQWRNWELFRDTFIDYAKMQINGELYVAPMYNLAIERGEDIRFNIVPTNQVLFCGTPDEYQFLLNSPQLLRDEN